MNTEPFNKATVVTEWRGSTVPINSKHAVFATQSSFAVAPSLAATIVQFQFQFGFVFRWFRRQKLDISINRIKFTTVTTVAAPIVIIIKTANSGTPPKHIDQK